MKSGGFGGIGLHRQVKARRLLRRRKVLAHDRRLVCRACIRALRSRPRCNRTRKSVYAGFIAWLRTISSRSTRSTALL